MGFISIIVSSIVCFFVSSSHLTIYGISILGCLYLAMLKPYYEMRQLCYIVALGGLMNLPLWKMIHSVGSIFHCLPGRIHASMVLGVATIVLSKVIYLINDSSSLSQFRTRRPFSLHLMWRLWLIPWKSFHWHSPPSTCWLWV